MTFTITNYQALATQIGEWVPALLSTRAVASYLQWHLVGLEVTGTPAAREAGGAAERWQVLTLRGDRIADIRGFDYRAAAAARAGVPA